MSRLSDAAVDAIARRVLERIGAGATSAGAATRPAAPAPALAPAQTEAVRRAGRLPPGVFASVDECAAAAAAAFKRFRALSLEQRKKIVAAVRQKMLEHCEELSREAVAETGLGRYEDKLVKNRLVTVKTPGPEALEPVAWTGDDGLTLVERAPFGVIAAITPVTNPTSTVICNGIGMLSAGNTVVFNVHPNARRVCCRTVGLINETIVQAGGPPDVLTAVAEPTIESAQQLWSHPVPRLVVVTGGPAVVKAAMQSGKRAICAGPGNPPVVVDETADLERAGRYIVYGASFDNNIICVDEKEVFVVDTVADKLLRTMEQHGAVVLTAPQARAVEKVIFTELRGPREEGKINLKMVGKNAGVILAEIGLRVPDSVRLAVMVVDADHPLVWSEQLMPVLPVVRVRSADEGIDLSVKCEHGYRHTAGMHSMHLGNLSRMAREMDCSIFVKNAPFVAGLGANGEGFTSFSIASPTGEGLTGPVQFSRVRRCVLKDHFRIV
ncbi:MAG: aldehyde dehydrogenase EutE [Deltaproteobacteria bacterium]|nr:aldehyde dehydrogenase EutE [Deltaproteobacteria bacterium]